MTKAVLKIITGCLIPDIFMRDMIPANSSKIVSDCNVRATMHNISISPLSFN